MDPDSSAQAVLLDELLELADGLGIEVRRVAMGGLGGGLATVRGRRVLFVDTDAGVDVQLDKCAAGLGRLRDELERVYVKPALRALLDGGP